MFVDAEYSSLYQQLVEVVRGGCGAGDVERQHAFGFHRNDIVLILEDALDEQKLPGGDQETMLLKKVGGNDGIRHPGFIFQAEEDKSLGGAGTLAGDHASANTESLSAGHVAEIAGGAHLHTAEARAMIGHGMGADGESGAMEVGDQTLFGIHGLQGRRSIGLRVLIEQRSGEADSALDLPESVAAVEGRFRVSSFGFRVRSFNHRGHGGTQRKCRFPALLGLILIRKREMLT